MIVILICNKRIRTWNIIIKLILLLYHKVRLRKFAHPTSIEQYTKFMVLDRWYRVALGLNASKHGQISGIHCFAMRER